MTIEQIKNQLVKMRLGYTRIINGRFVTRWAENLYEISVHRGSREASLDVAARTLFLFS